jgi:hypothetical protein
MYTFYICLCVHLSVYILYRVNITDTKLSTRRVVFEHYCNVHFYLICTHIYRVRRSIICKLFTNTMIPIVRLPEGRTCKDCKNQNVSTNLMAIKVQRFKHNMMLFFGMIARLKIIKTHNFLNLLDINQVRMWRK